MSLTALPYEAEIAYRRERLLHDYRRTPHAPRETRPSRLRALGRALRHAA